MVKLGLLIILVLSLPVGIVAAQMLKKYLNLKIEETKRKLLKDDINNIFK